MDRRSANRSIRTGLWAAGLAVLVFGLTFYVAILYVA
jgi:hypothetical protein